MGYLSTGYSRGGAVLNSEDAQLETVCKALAMKLPYEWQEILSYCRSIRISHRVAGNIVRHVAEFAMKHEAETGEQISLIAAHERLEARASGN